MSRNNKVHRHKNDFQGGRSFAFYFQFPRNRSTAGPAGPPGGSSLQEEPAGKERGSARGSLVFFWGRKDAIRVKKRHKLLMYTFLLSFPIC